MKARDLSLYLVLDPDLCGGLEGMLATTKTAVESGVTVVQLRAPGWKKRQWLSAARELKALLVATPVPLIINDQVDIALAVDADGVHVGQDDLPVAEVRRLIGPGKWLGLSISSRAELEAADLTGVDYLGIGPVFPTGSKLDAAPACGLAELADLVKLGGLPTVAIGGIGLTNCGDVLRAGADGVAVVSAICGQHDPAAATQKLAQAIRAARPVYRAG